MRKKAYSKDIIQTILKGRKRFVAIMIITILGVTMFSGLKASCQDLRSSADAFFDAQQLHDLCVVSTLGLTQDDVDALLQIEGVAAAEGIYSETLVARIGDKNNSISLQTLSDTGLGSPYLSEGRMPQQVNEALVTEKFLADTGARLGDTFVITEDLDEGDEDTDPEEATFACREYEIVGIVVNTLSIDNPSGAISFRSSVTTDEVVFVLPEAADADYFTSVYLAMEGGSELFCYGSDYEDQVAELKKRIEQTLKPEREQARYDQVTGDAYAELEDKESEVYAELADAYDELTDGEETLQRELSDAYRKLKNAEQELADGRAELADGWHQYNDGLAEADARFADAEQTLEDGKKTLEENRQSLEENKKLLIDGIAQAKDGLSQAENGLTQVNDGLAQIEASLPELEANKQALEEGIAQCQAGIAQLEAAIAQAEAAMGGAGSSGDLDMQSYDEAAEIVMEEEAAGEDDRAPEDGESESESEGGEGGSGAYPPGYETYLELKAQLEAAQAQLAELQGQQARLEAGLTQLYAQREALQGQKAQLEAQIPEIKATIAELESNLAQVNAGLVTIEEKSEELSEGEKTLAEEKTKAYDQLADARAELISGQAELNRGAGELADGWNDYYEGKAEGESELADGWNEYYDGLNEAEEKFADARAEIEDIDLPTWYVQDRTSLSGYSNIASDADSIEAIGTVFPIVFLLVAIMICLTTVTRMVEEDRGLIGTYKAMGFTDHEIRRKYLVYSGAASIAGCLIGTVMAFLVLPCFIIYVFHVMYLLPNYHFVFLPVTGAMGPIIFLIAILGATAMACRSELIHMPAVLMRPKTPKAGSKTFMERIPFVWNRLSFLNKVTARNIFRYKKRLIMTIGGIGGCMALLLFGFAIKDSVHDLMIRQYEQTFTYDLMTAVMSDDDNEKLLGYLEDEKDIAAYVNLYFSSIILKCDERSEISAQIMVVPDSEAMTGYVHLRSTDGELLKLEDGDIYVTQNAGELMNLTGGSVFNAQLADLTEADLTATAIVRNYMGNYIFMTQKTYEDMFETAYTPNAALVHVADGADTKAMADRLLDHDGIVTALSTDKMKEDFSEAFLLINMVVYIVILMSAALAFVVLFTLSTTNISERERELATVKVLGFFDHEVHLYVNKETYLLSAIGIILGIPLGYAFAQTLTTVLKLPSIYLAVSLHGISYVISAGLTIAFTIIVNVITNRTLNKIDPATALKSIE